MTIDLPLRGPATATLDQARAWARQRRGARLVDVDAYLAELWRLGTRLGYDPLPLAAQSSQATEGWTSTLWRERLNPARLAVSDGCQEGMAYANGGDAARAQLVHASAYARGVEMRLSRHLHLDPGWQAVFEAGDAGKVTTLAEMIARWAPDPNEAAEVGGHLRGIEQAVQTPAATPQPAPGGAPLPPGIVRLATGNWNERTFGQDPVAIVYHITDELSFDRVKTWFQNPASRASAHAVIDRDGTIYQFVSSTKAAWANDDVKNPRRDLPWLNKALTQHWSAGGPMRLDDYTLAIDHVGTLENPPTEPQYRSSIALSAYWRDRHTIAPHRGRLLRHTDLNPVDRPYCPGPKFDLRRIILALGGNPDDVTG